MSETIKYKRINVSLPNSDIVVTRHCNISNKRAKKIINRLYEKSKNDGPLVRGQNEILFTGSNKSIMRGGKDMFIFESSEFSKHLSSMMELFTIGFTHQYVEATDTWEPIELNL